MQSLRRLIPSPGALLAFEAAARLGSFTAAGRELNVTQAAVSFAVKNLEAALGVALFVRHHKRIELTESGERFYHDVAIGLGHIRRSAEQIRRRDRHVTLSISTGFATYWMMPRLAGFRAANPDIDLRCHTSDKDLDLAAERLDLGIYRGDGAWPEYDCTLLAPEEIYPVCSPDYRRGARVQSLAALARLDLIHLEEAFRPRPTWSDWLAAEGMAWRDDGKGLRLNDYALVLQAALEGEGVALGWHHLVEDAVRRGRLVRPVANRQVTGLGSHVVWPRRRGLSPTAARVRDWLLSHRR
ncbi:MAG: LysR substrate-binding domain-containing protein [Alphaproteobacteria bacterium]